MKSRSNGVQTYGRIHFGWLELFWPPTEDVFSLDSLLLSRRENPSPPFFLSEEMKRRPGSFFFWYFPVFLFSFVFFHFYVVSWSSRRGNCRLDCWSKSSSWRWLAVFCRCVKRRHSIWPNIAPMWKEFDPLFTYPSFDFLFGWKVSVRRGCCRHRRQQVSLFVGFWWCSWYSSVILDAVFIHLWTTFKGPQTKVERATRPLVAMTVDCFRHQTAASAALWNWSGRVTGIFFFLGRPALARDHFRTSLVWNALVLSPGRKRIKATPFIFKKKILSFKCPSAKSMRLKCHFPSFRF